MGSLLQLHRIIEWMIYEIKREEIANNYSVAHRKKLNSYSVAHRRFSGPSESERKSST